MCRVPDPIRWQTEQTRIDFLEAEVQTCSIALDMARFEYERGHIAFASREVESAQKGIAFIEKFLQPVREERQAELRRNWYGSGRHWNRCSGIFKEKLPDLSVPESAGEIHG